MIKNTIENRLYGRDVNDYIGDSKKNKEKIE